MKPGDYADIGELFLLIGGLIALAGIPVGIALGLLTGASNISVIWTWVFWPMWAGFIIEMSGFTFGIAGSHLAARKMGR